MYYTIYKITNLINGKIYIGKHKTKDLNDMYMGSGSLLKRSIKKYGAENFNKEILFVFADENSMNDKELELVNRDFCLSEDTYNINLGGNGGWDYVNSNNMNTIKNSDAERNKKISLAHTGKKRSLEHKNSISKSLRGRSAFWLKGKSNPEHALKISGSNNGRSIKLTYKTVEYPTIKNFVEETGYSYYKTKKMINNGEIVIKESLGE